VFGYDSRTEAHYSAGIGGLNHLYYLEEYEAGRGFLGHRTLGHPGNLDRDREHEIVVQVFGANAALTVDGVEIFEASLPAPLAAGQVGLTARGHGPIEFTSFDASPEQPKAFVVMDFSESYNTLYQEVIKPACEDSGYAPQRADDMFGPGIILAEIIRGIRQATVVIAEVTPVNANVFYEVGYAQASGTPTILLARRSDERLPFDISGQRCIFYDDSIGGKRHVDSELRRHLAAII
jgi:hypothetical protein